MIEFGNGGRRDVIDDDFTRENIRRIAAALACMRKHCGSRCLSLGCAGDHMLVSQWRLSKLLNREDSQRFFELPGVPRIDLARQLLADPTRRIRDGAGGPRAMPARPASPNSSKCRQHPRGITQWCAPESRKAGGPMRTLRSIRLVSDGFLKKYELLYDADGQEVRWEMFSLNPLKTAADLASRLTAVEIIARFEDGDYLLCREFRFPVNDAVYEFPTGMIDGDESPEEAAARELYEETGLKITRVDRVLPPACYSVGLTDELIVPVFVTVAGDMRDCDTPYEEIRALKMSLREIRQLLRTPHVKITETCMLVLSMLTDEA